MQAETFIHTNPHAIFTIPKYCGYRAHSEAFLKPDIFEMPAIGQVFMIWTHNPYPAEVRDPYITRFNHSTARRV